MEINQLFQKRIDKSLRIIEQMLTLCDNPYIALSFGKDSLVMVDLIYRIQRDIPCLFLKSEETFLLYDYERVIESWRESHNLNLHIVDTQRLSEHDHDWNAARKAGNKDFYRPEFFQGWDGVFMGLRIEESKARRITLIKEENNSIGNRIMQYKNGQRAGMYRCCPVADWLGWEIHTYLTDKQLPMLNIYSEGSHMRTTARLTGDAARQSALHWVKKSNPQNYNRLISMMPELKICTN